MLPLKVFSVADDVNRRSVLESQTFLDESKYDLFTAKVLNYSSHWTPPITTNISS